MNCPLCQQSGKQIENDVFFECLNCRGIFKDKQSYLDTDAEIKRYKEHENDVSDPRYQKFVSPITNFVLANFTAAHAGLDFGSGTAPVITKVLRDNGYCIEPFDPFFANNRELLTRTYDYIVCCEVMEHFHDPAAEFDLLHSLLKASGTLICMTHLYEERIPFKNWYYRNDSTHVFIYRAHTLQVLAGMCGFGDLFVQDRLIVMKK